MHGISFFFIIFFSNGGIKNLNLGTWITFKKVYIYDQKYNRFLLLTFSFWACNAGLVEALIVVLSNSLSLFLIRGLMKKSASEQVAHVEHL